jgi:hypothetical protein
MLAVLKQSIPGKNTVASPLDVLLGGNEAVCTERERLLVRSDRFALGI